MNYEGFIKNLKRIPQYPVPDKIWQHIEHDLKARQHQVSPAKLLYFFPRLALVSAAAAVLAIALINYTYRTELGSYIQNLSSTEYIYENCRYPG
jgi:hypothetical protein